MQPVEEPPLPPGTAEAEIRSAIEIVLILDMTYTSPTQWRNDNEVRLKQVIANILHLEDGLHRLKLLRITRGTIGKNDMATSIEFAILPPQGSSATENAMEEKMAIEKAVLDGTMATAMREAGIKTGDVLLVKADVATKAYTDVKSRCKRCRNGREQAENDHREFTRKCNRDGSCKKNIPFTIQDACARGCADHCSQTCKRFHDPKAKQCAARRRLHKTSDTAMQPESAVLNNAPVVTNLIQLDEDMRQFIKSSVDSQNLLSIEQVQDSSEAAVVAQCFGECAHSCIETCIGQWSEAVPDETKTEDALEASTTNTASVTTAATPAPSTLP